MQDTDEIDLLEFFQTIWDGKFKIAGVIVMAVLGVVGFFYTQPPPSFTAKTEVKPITSDIANRYQISNSLGFFEVGTANLQNLFIEQLDTRLLFEDAFRKHAVLDKNEFETEQEAIEYAKRVKNAEVWDENDETCIWTNREDGNIGMNK